MFGRIRADMLAFRHGPQSPADEGTDMDISRGFIVMGAVYLVVGIVLGAYMGGSGDHSLAPVHAHINLLGFTLMTVFGFGYRLIPGLAEGTLPGGRKSQPRARPPSELLMMSTGSSWW